ncbi:lantibiotic protection ABC transporter ATP-binding subunit [Apilactobacillus kunkeei]|uniref:lantibiotic protection ABC transporter ATP-binding subunit n=1 Tax=Apilactobacillus kunkeei TaxID=148814 RepID=UPI00200B890E|nr:lantibiotic protection ABC transporter ATP-binding subunit [Apilactobacillus kunkeei]MCK8635995.1 lantibiotic protection ABC transporter ATP-binding subunit [Apilactobacillus kunkeei]
MKNILETKNITKSFKDQLALDNVSVHIPKGEVYCLLGPNGAGKTTLMKIITGMIRETSGQVLFDGKKWERSVLNDIGSLIENAPIYGNLTALENLKVVAALRSVPLKNLESILEQVGLDNNNKKSKDFSLGMKQRLGIGMAMVSDPKLLILDEPTNGLDPIGIQELRTLIKGLSERDITILVSSHDLSEVEHLADNIGIISGGKLLLEEKYNNEDLEKLFNEIVKGV